MNNFKSDDRSRDRRDSPRRGSGNRDSGRLTLHDAVCDECGRDCQVPFKPSNDKPIYCSDCFEKKGGRDGGRSGQRDSRDHNFKNREQSRPTQNNTNDRGIQKLAENIGVLNTKLDAIISLLSSAEHKKIGQVKSVKEKNKKPKPKLKSKKTAKK